MSNPTNKNKFFDKIEKLLVQQNIYEDLKLNKNPQFQIESDNQWLQRVFSQADQTVSWTLLFSRLNIFFEIGLLVENQDIQKMFYYGDFVEKKAHPINFKLPKSPYFNILKTSGLSFFKKMGLAQIPHAEKYTCLLIRVDENKYIILFTQLAEPWLQLRCQSLHKALIMHDFYPVETDSTSATDYKPSGI